MNHLLEKSNRKMHPHLPTAENFMQTMFFLPHCFYI